MTVRLFGMMGVLAHEKKPVWYEPLPGTQCPALAYEATVEIPDELQPYRTVTEETAVTVNGLTIMLNDVLVDTDDGPAIRWFDALNYPHTIKLPPTEA